MLRSLLVVALVGFAACRLPSAFVDDLASSVGDEGQLWAIIVAGSNGWDNYRHQADICHAYHILNHHGIPDERIVVMMTDDIANNPSNPTPGIIINHPDGVDVYHGVPHDYTKDDVTPKNFLNILQGNEEAMEGIGSGKVVKSGPNDHVFFYFADHGAPGFVCFPDLSTGDEQFLYAKSLMEALENMYNEKKYKKMVIYIEACESGSMFSNLLPNNMSIFATTAANPFESSYAVYFDEKRETYLGDVYSVNWMEDSDMENLSQETLNKQFKIVKKETTQSHVQEYGDLSIGKMTVGEFQGGDVAIPIIHKPASKDDAVPSRDVPLEIAKRKYIKAKTLEEKHQAGRKILKMLRHRQFVDDIVKHIVKRLANSEQEVDYVLTNKQEIKNFDCYEEAVRHFHKECFNLNKNTYVLGKLHFLINICENNVPVKTVKKAMEAMCIHPPVYGIV